MLFSASIFIPVKPKGFNFTKSEKLSYFSLGAMLFYCLILILIERILGYQLNEYFYYPLIFTLLLHLIGIFVRFSEYENLNGYFEGTISFEEDFLIINTIEYKYSGLENLVIYGNSFSGERTENYKYGPMHGNGIKNLISFTYNGVKIEKHFQLNSERHLRELQNTLIHIISAEKIPFKKEYLNFINDEHRSYILFEFLIGKLIKEKKIGCQEGINLIGLKSKYIKEFRAKYCC